MFDAAPLSTGELIEQSSVGRALAARAAWRRLGALVREARHCARWTIADLADRANLACSVVRDIETGCRCTLNSDVRELSGPTDHELLSIGRALDVDAWKWLLMARGIRRGDYVGGQGAISHE